MSAPPNMFVGIEAEGRYTGIRTLFVGSPASPEAIIAWAASEKVGHVLIGAKGFVPDEQYLRIIGSNMGYFRTAGLLVTLHLPLASLIQVPAVCLSSDMCHVLVYQYCPHAHLLGGNVELKVENEGVAMVYTRPLPVSLTYLSDKPVS